MKENTESNKLIAEFMGLKIFSDRTPSLEHWWAESEDSVTTYAGTWPFQDPPPFDRNWNYLMPVVEKIEELGYKFMIDGNVVTEKGYHDWYAGTTNESKIECVYIAVLKVITYYNTLP